MENAKLHGIIEAIGAADKMELDMIFRAFKLRRDGLSNMALAHFNLGDEVINTHDSRRLPRGAKGRVIKINIKKVVVDFGVHRTWHVPPSMLAPAVVK